MMRWLIAFAVGISASATLIAQENSPTDLDFFEKRVRPVLVQRCFECHSTKTEKLKGGLLLDSREGIFAGGDSGPAAVHGDLEKSLIVQAIRYDGDTQMPPAGKLPEAEIALLTEWVRRGLPFPSASAVKSTRKQIDIAEGKKHWAFRPLQNGVIAPLSLVLRIENERQSKAIQSGADTPHSRAKGRIDSFVHATQYARGLSSSAEASRANLIRRVTFDLLGLPPTMDEMREFLSDESPDAYDRLIERLLADPRFAERWARTWLDLARYCDIGESWRTGEGQPWLYRDWVVRAMNEDLPFHEFVRQQLATDLLPNQRPEDAAALGFLGLSPSYWKELKLDHNVIKQVVAEEWEERIEAIGGTFLGLTLACARCHDHKFDPITQQDYYGLAGVLASIKIDDVPIIRSDLARRAADARTQLKDAQGQLDKLLKEPKPADDATHEAKAKAAESAKQIEVLKTKIAELQTTPHLNTPVAFGVTEAAMHVLPDGPNRTKIEYKPSEPQNVAMQIRGNAANPGAVVSRRFVSVLSPNEPTTFTNGSGRLELANALVTDAAPLVARVIVNRIWAHHFGRGLVATPSNFGTQGEKPTHPELLDDLATRFIEHGWSLKWLHREITLSATYRQRSADGRYSKSSERSDLDRQPSAFGQQSSADPDNVWLARMPVRKLDVEAWRDAMLVATGEMDRRIRGEPQELSDNANTRRTIYGLVRRRELSDLLRLHDFPDPVSHSGSRMLTTTPLQQLFVLNSSFMQARAAAFARGVQAERPNDLAAQIAFAYERLFQRDPTNNERATGIEFLKASQADGLALDAAWKQYAQALLASNELQFVD